MLSTVRTQSSQPRVTLELKVAPKVELMRRQSGGRRKKADILPDFTFSFELTDAPESAFAAARQLNTVLSEFIDAALLWAAELHVELNEILASDTYSADDKATATAEASRRFGNLRNSQRFTNKFLAGIASQLRETFLPAVAIDNDGEIDFEWYGRQGARASVTIGANGVLYFVLLFHGESFSRRLPFSDNVPDEIIQELDRIYQDKINE